MFSADFMEDGREDQTEQERDSLCNICWIRISAFLRLLMLN